MRWLIGMAFLAGCTITVPAPVATTRSVPVIMAPVAAPCLIDGEKKACVILLADDYAKLEAALCDGRSGCKLGP